jgi:hypothetical protein
MNLRCYSESASNECDLVFGYFYLRGVSLRQLGRLGMEKFLQVHGEESERPSESEMLKLKIGVGINTRSQGKRKTASAVRGRKNGSATTTLIYAKWLTAMQIGITVAKQRNRIF